MFLKCTSYIISHGVIKYCFCSAWFRLKLITKIFCHWHLVEFLIPQQILEPFIVYLSEEFTKKWVFVKLCLGVDFKKESIIIFWVFWILCSKKNVFKIDIGIQFFILGSKRNGFKVDLGQHILLCSFTVQLIYLVRPPIFIHPGLSSHWRKCLLQNIFYISLTLNCCLTPTIEVELIFSFFNIGLDSSLFAWYL